MIPKLKAAPDNALPVAPFIPQQLAIAVENFKLLFVWVLTLQCGGDSGN
jgi:hypothetical protein